MGLWEQMQRAEEKRALAKSISQQNPVRETVSVKEVPENAKRGPKPSGKAKRLITLRLDQDVIEGFKSTGDGWQSRINAELRRARGL